MRILVFEPDKPLSRFLQRSLEAEEYVVDIAAEVQQAKHMAQNNAYSLVILDLEDQGLLEEIRSRDANLPILVLSTKGEVKDRVRGLNLGADDYLPKPFAFSELAARARRLLMRLAPPVETELRSGDLKLSRMARTVSRAANRIDLSPKEFALLEYLMRHQGQTVGRDAIVENVWHLSPQTLTNVVDVYISYLRRKIDDGFETKLIHTVRGRGYRVGSDWVTDAEADEARAA